MSLTSQKMPRRETTNSNENSQKIPQWLITLLKKQEENSQRQEERMLRRDEESREQILALQEQLMRQKNSPSETEMQPEQQSAANAHRQGKMPTPSKPSTFEVDSTYGKLHIERKLGGLRHAIEHGEHIPTDPTCSLPQLPQREYAPTHQVCNRNQRTRKP